MADVGINPGAWTDPRMLLAQQLIQGSSDASPVRSWTQELARALSGPIGAYEANQVRGDRTNALTSIYGGGTGQPTQEQPGLFARLGNFLNGTPNTPNGGQTQQLSPTGAVTPTSGTPDAPQGAGTTSGAPGGPQATQAGTSGAPSQQSAQASPAGGMAGGLAQQMYTARRMMQVGREQNQPDLVQQGAQMLQAIQQEQAKAQADAIGKAAGEGRNYDPMANNGQGGYTGIPGFNDTVGATKAAEARATAMGGLDPAVTAGKIGQENAVNTGTMGTAAAKAGAVSGADASARNASDLAYAAPITTAKDTAAAKVALATQPALDAAKLAATNTANAGKPLTPTERNTQEQTLSQHFQELPIVKEHIAASQGYQNVLAAAKGTDKASDINLIDGLVKMFNPGATVRQSTFENFMEHSQGIPDNIIGIVQSVKNGAHLQPETRAQLVAQATDRMNASRQIYNQLSGFATQQAVTQGLNPRNVVPNFIDPLTAQEVLAQRRAAAAQGQPVQQ